MTLRILVIDDDEAIRLSLSFLLNAKGFDVLFAEDAATGLAKFLEHSPDVVISDMIMPGSAGIETIGRIRSCNATIPIIAMSGSIEGGPASLLKRARNAGADYCLEKPFEGYDVLDILDNLANSGTNQR